jgi:hypothetical protein
MESVYHIVAIRVNEISWAHIWRLRSRYLGMGYDISVAEKASLVGIGTARGKPKCALNLFDSN